MELMWGMSLMFYYYKHKHTLSINIRLFQSQPLKYSTCPDSSPVYFRIGEKEEKSLTLHGSS